MVGPTLLKNFIVFEGGDGAGSDTQADKLAQVLRSTGQPVWRTNEPTETHTGFTVRKILRGELEHPGALKIQQLMVADRKRHLDEIQQHLASGSVVICVRYLYSTLAYGMADGIEYKVVWEMNKNFPRPERVFYLDLSPREAMERIVKRGNPQELFEKEEFLTRVRENFLWLAKLFPEVVIIQAAAPELTIHKCVQLELRKSRAA